MPIISAKSISDSMNIVANESYGEHDFGRIMYESAINDGIIFNSAVLREFQEIDAIREGTMISSELRSFQEFSVREAWNGLKEKLKKLWEKIKGIFRKVTAKLAVWFVRNGKAYVAMNKRLLHADVAKCKIPEFRKKNNGVYAKLLENNISNTVKDITSKRALYDGENRKWDNIASNAGEYSIYIIRANYPAISNTLRDSGESADLSKVFIDAAFGEKKTNANFGELGVSVGDLFDTISTGKKPIKDLKKAEKEADKSIKKVIKEIDKLSNENKDETKSDIYKNASMYCSGFQTAMTKVTKAQIAMVKFDIKQSRACVSKLAAYSPTNENALFEMSCWVEGAEVFDEEFDSIDESAADDDDIKDELDIDLDED